MDNKRVEKPAEASKKISREGKRIGFGGFGMQAGIGRGPGTQERVTRGLESTTLCGLVEGSRGAFLKSEDNGDSRLDWDPSEGSR